MTKDGDPKDWEFGWYPDPDHPGEERYWTGGEWTQRRPAPTAEQPVEHADDPKQTKLWFVVGAVVIVAIVGIVLVVVSIDQTDPLVVEDDDAEFREVSITECEPPGALTGQQVRGVAENGSSERSDYQIEFAAISSDGTRIGTGSTDVRGVEPGQRAVWTGETDAAEQDWDDGSTCEVLSVERTASL